MEIPLMHIADVHIRSDGTSKCGVRRWLQLAAAQAQPARGSAADLDELRAVYVTPAA
jgi:hypothetical protein